MEEESGAGEEGGTLSGGQVISHGPLQREIGKKQSAHTEGDAIAL